MVQNQDDHQQGFTDITVKQREALELAVKHDYFEISSEITLTELSNLAGISRQAYTRWLTRAQNSIFS